MEIMTCIEHQAEAVQDLHPADNAEQLEFWALSKAGTSEIV